ncbi:polysaccharide deacetylase family protein [Halobacteria archaeon HArc-gm2]|nr:polysaccharide deacetylase family protein [Halobacteria archaeon HArc-gm2]
MSESEWVPGDHEFALCLTHDVDRPYKTYQSLYYALKERDPSHLRGLLPGSNPYWTFQEMLDLESELGVTSAFYFLNEQDLFADRPPRDWLSGKAWQLYAGRYEIEDPEIISLIREIDDRGWEVGLHGSYESYADREMLATEKRHLEDVLGHEVVGGRQHYLNIERPETWTYQRAAGLQYDATPGSSLDYGFHDGYDPYRPFDDAFVVFPLTLMECALPDPGANFEKAWQICERLLTEAAANDAVMSVLWHPRFFSDDYPGYDVIYRRIVEKALEMDAWVGAPGTLYETLDHQSAPQAVAEERASQSAD